MRGRFPLQVNKDTRILCHSCVVDLYKTIGIHRPRYNPFMTQARLSDMFFLWNSIRILTKNKAIRELFAAFERRQIHIESVFFPISLHVDLANSSKKMTNLDVNKCLPEEFHDTTFSIQLSREMCLRMLENYKNDHKYTKFTIKIFHCVRFVIIVFNWPNLDISYNSQNQTYHFSAICYETTTKKWRGGERKKNGPQR